MTPTSSPPQYKPLQRYHCASEDIAIAIFDTDIVQSVRSTRQYPTMSGNHAMHLSASHAPRADIGNDPGFPRRPLFVQWLRNTSTAVRWMFALHCVCFYWLFIHLAAVSSRLDCANAPKMTGYLNFIQGALTATICSRLPTMLGLHHYFVDSTGARWVFTGLGWWFAIIIGRGMVTTWALVDCET